MTLTQRIRWKGDQSRSLTSVLCVYIRVHMCSLSHSCVYMCVNMNAHMHTYIHIKRKENKIESREQLRKTSSHLPLASTHICMCAQRNTYICEQTQKMECIKAVTMTVPLCKREAQVAEDQCMPVSFPQSGRCHCIV